MAGYNRNNRYQYETSPRKLEPEYRPVKKSYPKKSTVKKQPSQKIQENKKQKNKLELGSKAKAILYVAMLFTALFAISYRNAVISEKYSQIKNIKANLATIEKENEQIEVNIESKTNLGTVEKEAKNKLGMQKLKDNQKIYVNLDKQDYIESATDNVVLNQEQNIFQKIISKIQNLF